MKAIWKNTIIAESDATIVVEDNHYFPPASVHNEFLRPSNHHTYCIWKGRASYYDVVVDDAVNKDAAWYYPEAKPEADNIKGYVAFWHGVEISE